MHFDHLRAVFLIPETASSCASVFHRHVGFVKMRVCLGLGLGLWHRCRRPVSDGMSSACGQIERWFEGLKQLENTSPIFSLVRSFVTVHFDLAR